MNINISGEVVRTSQLPKRIIGLGDYLIALNSSPLETSTVLVSDFVSFLNTQFATSLASLTDVSINTPLVGQALVFNGSYWVNQNLVSSLAGLSDVTIASLNPDQLLRYDGTSWKNWTPTFYSLPLGGTTLQYIDGTGALQTFPTALPTGTVRHQVKAGVPITKGQAVYVTSADGTNMIVGLASNASESTSSKTMGLLDATVSTNDFANIVTEGLLTGLDTTGANAAGDPVWLGTGGNLIYGLVNKPYAPNHLVFIGIVTRRNANNGEIFVKVQNGFELDELHNVDARNPNNNDGIFYNSTTQLWEHKQISAVAPTPTLAQVTTAGNTTTNAIGTGNITVSASNIASLTLLDTLQPYSWQIRNNGTSLLFVNNSGNNLFRINANGNVLIGTNTDAGYKLDVNGTARVQGATTINNRYLYHQGDSAIQHFMTSNAWSGINTIFFGDDSSSTIGSISYNHQFDSLSFNVNGSNALFINSSRNVGIGTTTPAAKLHVSGSVTASTALAQGVFFNNTLVAAANNDVLVGLDINPTFTNGAFTGVTNYALRTTNSTVALFDSILYSQAGASGSNTSFSITGTAGSNYTVDSSRNLIFNTGQSMYFNTDTDGGSAADRAWYFGGARSTITGGRTYVAITTDGSGFPSLTIYNNDNGPRIQLNSNAASYFNGGNLLVGTSTDAGYKLDVSGTFRTLVGTETNPFRLEHTNGNYMTMVVGAGSALAAGQFGMYFNGSPMWSWNGAVFRLHGNTISTASNPSTLVVQGGYGGSTVGTSIRLSSNTPNQGQWTATTGAQITVEVGNHSNETWAPSSGNASYTLLSIAPRINTTGTYAGIVRGFYYNPTLTSVTGTTHRAIETTSGDVIFNGGQVGIGTTSPTGRNGYGGGTLVEIVNNTAYASLNINGGNISAPTYLTFGAQNSGADIRVNNKSLQFTINSIDALKIATTGNVLINTVTDAGYKLDVLGNTRVQVSSAGVPNILHISNLQTDAGPGGAIAFYTGGGISNASRIVAVRSGTSGQSDIGLETTGVTRLFVAANSGNVGIGTTSPFGKLDVKDGEIYVTTSTNANLRSRLTYQGLSVSRASDGGYPEQIISTDSAWQYHSRNRHTLYIDTIPHLQIGHVGISGLNIPQSNNIIIGNSADNGYKLQVKGNAYLAGSAGTTTLNVDFGNVNSNVKILSHGSSDFTQIQIGTNFSLSRNGGGDPSIGTTFGLGIISSSLSLQTSTASPGKLWLKGNYGLGSAYFGANNSNGVTASTLYFQNSETPTAAQNVLATFNLWGISDNATAPTIPASSMFSLHSTTRGFLPPRLTTAEILAISSPSEGLQVYNTDLKTICFYNGTAWQRVTSTAM